MKLICDSVVTNLQHSSHSVVPRNRTKKCQINVGKHDDKVYIVIQSGDNKSGNRYKISENIAQIFERFAREGKCTLRLKQPPMELAMSNCDPLQLAIFLKVIKLGQLPSPDGDGKKLLGNLPTSYKKLKSLELSEKTRTELCITSRKQLLSAHFSQLLVKLEIVGLDLSQIPPSISKLTKLQILNLSDNKIQSLPTSMVASLRELNMKGNQLNLANCKTWWFFSLPHIKQNLQILDISLNNLPYLPLQICDVKNLVKLNLKGNKIQHYPPCFGNLRKLRHLDLSDNAVDAIDTTFQYLRLDTLDMSGNYDSERPTNNILVFNPFTHRTVPSLLQLSSVVVVNSRLDQSELPLTLQEHLYLLRRCRCLHPVPHTSRSVVQFDLTTITRNLISDSPNKNFPMAMYYCNNPMRCRTRSNNL